MEAHVCADHCVFDPTTPPDPAGGQRSKLTMCLMDFGPCVTSEVEGVSFPTHRGNPTVTQCVAMATMKASSDSSEQKAAGSSLGGSCVSPCALAQGLRQDVKDR